ncbi:hypothetical protein WK92_15080 [Burkholderia ubonensis]|nr:hypothetical protein WK82_14210 [Burkholderia ubonensis]KVW21752.1 hypothetical protein WK92_15080 [Burkholderia ubonensis]
MPPDRLAKWNGEMDRIRVGVADSQPIVLIGLKSLFIEAPDMDALFFVDTGKKLMVQLRAQAVDVLLCDYGSRGSTLGEGFSLLRLIVDTHASTRVVVFSAASTPYVAQAALTHGAAGFLGKCDADPSHLKEAIRSVHAGRIYLPPTESMEVLSNVFGSNTARLGIESLSSRELEVTQKICAGLTISEIANRLSRSPKTISNQKHAAMRKLGVRSDAELVMAMRDLGLF